MTTQPIKLIQDGPPDGAGRQKYEPLISTVIAVSKYNADQFGLQGLTGYWQWSKTPPLKVGQKAKFWLTTKPKTGPSAKPGALYMDIAGWEPISPDADGNEYQAVGTSEGPQASAPPVDKDDSRAEPPAPARSPLAGIQVPAEWSMPIEYWLWHRQTERKSIESQVLWKINAERQIAGARMRTDLAIAALGAKPGTFDKDYTVTLFADAQKVINDLLFEQAQTDTTQVQDAVSQEDKPEGEANAPW